MLAAETNYPLLQVFLSMLYFFLFVIWIWIAIMVVVDIFRSHDMGGAAKTFWVLFVIIIPLLGVLVYLIARGNGMSQRALDQQKEMQAAQLEYAKTLVGGQGADATSQIAEAKKLLDSGAITQAEFDQMKAKALA